MATATKVPSDIAIAQAAKLRPIADVAAEVGLTPDEILPYGRYKAKISAEAIARRKPKGRLVLVTGINPTPAGEGKSTVTVGVSQALRRLGEWVNHRQHLELLVVQVDAVDTELLEVDVLRRSAVELEDGRPV
jgi:Mrp family chromosome partitioning ATPase